MFTVYQLGSKIQLRLSPLVFGLLAWQRLTFFFFYKKWVMDHHHISLASGFGLGQFVIMRHLKEVIMRRRSTSCELVLLLRQKMIYSKQVYNIHCPFAALSFSFGTFCFSILILIWLRWLMVNIMKDDYCIIHIIT